MEGNLNGAPKGELTAEQKKSFFRNPRFKHGSLATAITAVVIVVIVLLNVAVTLLEKRVDLRFDITANHLFSLTDEAKEYFASVGDDVTITVLSSEDALRNFSAACRRYFPTSRRTTISPSNTSTWTPTRTISISMT